MTLLLKIKSLIATFLLLLLKFFKPYSVDFIKFIFNKNIIQLAIGIIISTQVGKLTESFTVSIINPILQKISFTKNEFKDLKYNRLGIKFKIGDIITNLISFFIILTIVFYIWSLSTNIDIKIINNIMDSIENYIKTI